MPISIERRGLMLVLSSPSGAGKTTISRRLLAEDSELAMSVSVTTRPKRLVEIEGQDYFFTDISGFKQMVEASQLLEYATVFDHHYGTPKAPVEAALAGGCDVLFDIDWQGTQQLKQQARDDLVSIFILPPSTEELERRLRQRAQDPETVVLARMAKAADEISHWAEYDYVVVNTDVEKTLLQVQAILKAERLRRERQPGLLSFVHVLRGKG